MKKTAIYALGVFDGVHTGHSALLSACRRLCAETGAEAGVVTFSTHPDTLVMGKTPPFINTLEDRESLLRQFSITRIVSLPFDRRLMQMPWQDFLALLQAEYGAAGFVCGEDFRFGKDGEGNPALLQQACNDAGLACAVVPEQVIDGVPVSSSYIRLLLKQGQMEQAVRLLGHPHRLTGTVISGKQLGRSIGTPTANLALPASVVAPKYGVYACKALVDGRQYPAVTNIGTCPTVNGQEVRVESWLLDFSGNLYGKTLTLEFYSFLREEQKFPSLADLQAEIQKNALQTRKFFENN